MTGEAGPIEVLTVPFSQQRPGVPVPPRADSESPRNARVCAALADDASQRSSLAAPSRPPTGLRICIRRRAMPPIHSPSAAQPG